MNRQSMIVAAAMLSTAALPLGGCMSSTYGDKIEANNVSKIVKGKTTKAEVIAMFGQPMQTVINPTGGRTMMFVYYKSTIGGMLKNSAQVFTGKHRGDGSTTNLTVVLDSNDIVSDFEHQAARK